MAIEEAIEEGGEVEKPKKGPNKGLLIAIAVLLFTLISVGGYLVYSNMTSKKAAPTDAGGHGSPAPAAAPEEVQDPLKLGEIVAFEPFIVNLSGEGGKRFLKVTLQVELSQKSVAEELNNKLPLMKDSIITVLASKTVDELLTVEGKFRLKEQILTRINSNLKTGVAKNIYFVEFVMQ